MELRFAFPRVYGMLSVATLGAFVLTGGFYSIWPAEERTAPEMFRQFVAGMPSLTIQSLMEQEIPGLTPEGASPPGSVRDWARAGGRIILGLDTADPASWIAAALPGFVAAGEKPAPDPTIAGTAKTPEGKDVVSPDVAQPSAVNPTAGGDRAPAAGNVPLLFIYHSHNRESWLPELKGVKDPNQAFDAKINVTLLGQRLKEQLEKNGVPALQSTVDYPAVYDAAFLKSRSYAYSKTIVKEALASTPSLKYLIDIHRDSGPRKGTTVSIGGKDYAKLYFVVGLENPSWKENRSLAEKLESALNAKYPGISRGIDTKDHTEGNGVYNQDLSPGSELIEIGGVENTLEECYRTVDALADVLSEMIKAQNKT